jgi:hypothetical protein
MHLWRWMVGTAAVSAMCALVRCGGAKDCASSADCDTGQKCVFGETAGCSAKGTCANGIDNCDSTFARQVCGCHGDISTEAKCTDVAGFLAPVTPNPHCFDPDAGVLNPDASDEAPIIQHDSAVRDTSIDTSEDTTTDVRDAGRG